MSADTLYWLGCASPGFTGSVQVTGIGRYRPHIPFVFLGNAARELWREYKVIVKFDGRFRRLKSPDTVKHQSARNCATQPGYGHLLFAALVAELLVLSHVITVLLAAALAANIPGYRCVAGRGWFEQRPRDPEGRRTARRRGGEGVG